MGSSALEQFVALDALRVRHGFTGRIPGIDVAHDKDVALAHLDAVHRKLRGEIGDFPFATAKQIHGNEIAVIDQALAADRCFDGCDGLITNQRDLALGIYIADCAAVYLVDRERRAIGLVHSGRKGTELGIVARAIALLETRFGVPPRDLVAQISPCIRPPHYEVDFAAEIARQCRDAGVIGVHDCGICTACDLERYYSYRAEKGKTGRMLALLAIGSAND
ncbi:MAG: polyphenol oxidase family protein [Verrucomicrobiota bacterium]|nr:polyphenol oxidase family protein [Verrucomicrobiota bacterium]